MEIEGGGGSKLVPLVRANGFEKQEWDRRPFVALWDFLDKRLRLAAHVAPVPDHY